MGDDIQRQAAPLPPVDPSTAKIIWLTIVGVFSAAMLISVIMLGLSVFIPPATGGTSGQLVLTVITTAAGFLAGLLAPSPVTK